MAAPLPGTVPGGIQPLPDHGALQVTHLGHEPALYEPALHPYFQVGDIRRVRISGRDNAPFTEHGTTHGGQPRISLNDRGVDRVYWRSFVCVEAGNVQENAITLAPGEQHGFRSEIQVVPHTDKHSGERSGPTAAAAGPDHQISADRSGRAPSPSPRPPRSR